MRTTDYEEKLKREFMKQAGTVFERVMAENGKGEGVTLSQIEEKVGELRFELTSRVVESKIKLEVNKQQGPASKCEGCDREMRDKGLKKRMIITSQGEVELERRYNYCPHCRQGLFPAGPTTEA